MAAAIFAATNLPLVFDQASAFTLPLKVVDASGVVLELLALGYGARAAFRGGDENAVLIEKTTTNGGIVLADADPNLQMFVTATDSASLEAQVGGWDIYLDPNGTEDGLSFRVVYGAWQMNIAYTP